MDISDFKIGQKVYILRFGKYDHNEKSYIEEVEVMDVGQKSVIVKDSFYPLTNSVLFLNISKLNYLVEDKQKGRKKLLFKSLNDIYEYLEWRELKREICQKTCYDKIGQYSLEQLRAVNTILDGE